MKTIRLARQRAGFSQRRMAQRAGLSFRAIQLLEQEVRDMRLSTLLKATRAVGLPESGVSRIADIAPPIRFLIKHLNLQPPDLVFDIISAYTPRRSIPAKTQFLIEEIFESRTP